MAHDTYSVMIHKSKKSLIGLVTRDEKEARAFAAEYAHDPKWTATPCEGATRYSFVAGPVEV